MDDCDHPRDAFLRRQFGCVLRELGREILPEDGIIANAFLRTDHHVSVDDLLGMLRGRHGHIDASHVRRTMRMLCDLGIAQKIELDNRTVFEHLHLGAHHDHMVCVRCGAIKEFSSPAIEERQVEECHAAGFEPLAHNLVIRGVCSNCMQSMPKVSSLASCLPGEVVAVSELAGGYGLNRRLMDLGLVKGTNVKILSSDGPVTVEVRGSRLALGLGQARRIMVERIGKGFRKEQ